MNRMRSPGMLPSAASDALLQQIKQLWDAFLQLIKPLWHTLVGQLKSKKRFFYIIFAVLALLSVLVYLVVYAAALPSVQAWRRVMVYGQTVRDDEKNWQPLTTREAEWESHFQELQERTEDKNWAGLKRLRKHRAFGSLWWDERAEDYFITKLEANQFPADCSQAHWIAHYDWVAGLLSSVHVLFSPLFFALVRGHTLVPISVLADHQHAFDGCGPRRSQHNIQCFFNVTTCNPGDDVSRLEQILAKAPKEAPRTTWEEVLMQEDDFFSPGGVTVIRSLKLPPWDMEVYVASSSFESYVEAFTYYKLTLWNEMGRHGKVGVVTDSIKTCPDCQQGTRQGRVDLVITSLMSSWMLNRMPNTVKLVADEIMSRYVDDSGKPLWNGPVLAIHIRQTDKTWEDPYYQEHQKYRPVEDYALRMQQMEEEFGFQWPSIFLVSDSGTALESLMAVLNGTTDLAPQPQRNGTNSGAPPQEDLQRYVMYDWMADDHLVEKFKDHIHVPEDLKRDMETHFLATLYIVQKIADHAIVTYSSNVGRFIGEIIAAKQRIVFPDPEGPLVTSLDYGWFWQ